MVPPLSPAFELSVRRSRLRSRVLLMLCSLGEAYPSQLAVACGVDARRVRWALEGRLPAYSPALSLVGLGLAEVVAPGARRGRVYRITGAGRRKARSLARRVAVGRRPRPDLGWGPATP